MKLVNVTNSYSRLVFNQLNNTDTNTIKVFTLGNTTVIFSEADKHIEIVLKNDKRNIQKKEIDFVCSYFKRKLKDRPYDFDDSSCIESPGLVELSIKKTPAKSS